jgi:aryl-alcohol dehydrogenase-like predicted oxidoreductase
MSGFDGPSRDRETGLAVLRRAVELGVNHIDTAEFYRGRDGGRASTSSSGRHCTPTRRTW